MSSVKGQKMVIIGGSSGMGFASAKQLAELGAEVVIAGRVKEKLLGAQKRIKGTVQSHCLDINDEHAVKEFFHKVGSFDHLITPAASTSSGTFIDSQAARASFDSKFWGQYHAAKYGSLHMRSGGSIVLFSGTYGKRPISNVGIMAAINCAIEGLARALAVDLAPIRVNVICPGYIDTPVWKKVEEKERENLFNDMKRELAVKRLGTADEVAQGVLYLITNSYTTGTILYIDGGYALR